MGYREDMEECRAYIDGHLAEEITPQALAARYSYSFYHFCHVFRAVNGMAVCEYLRNGRLGRAAAELLGGRSVTEVALDCGFDTPSGFDRAFSQRFQMSPTEYKKQKGGYLVMKPEIRKFASFTAVGYVLKPQKEINILENGAYWLGKDFSAVSKEDYAKLCVSDHGEIGCWMHPDEGGELYYFFGPMVQNRNFIPQGMEAIDVPAAEYAVFTVPKADTKEQLRENIQKTWKFIFSDWFDGSNFKFDHKAMDFEYYLRQDTFIYVPVVKK